MSIEPTPTAKKSTPYWFTLPKFSPTQETLLHAAELRIALAEKQTIQAACKRTPRGYLKKGEEVPYQEAKEACDAVFRKHSRYVREAMLQENEEYIKRAKSQVFTRFIGGASRFNEAISAFHTEVHFTPQGDPVIHVKSRFGNDFKFRFTIDACLISRVEVYGDERWSIVSISYDRWCEKKGNTKIGSISMSRGEADAFIEFAWVIEHAARLCQDVSAFNDENEGDFWVCFNTITTKAEKEAYGITWDDCLEPDPVEKTEEQDNTPTA